MVALDTLVSGPETTTRAFTLLARRVDNLSAWTVLASPVLRVVVLISGTGNAALAVEDWRRGWAVYAFLDL